ncbi:MAG: Hsp20/alpha crystallin family protein [Treponema sp.]|nr:Hsp20/alpha crystallin family protein [Treponema sp.]
MNELALFNDLFDGFGDDGFMMPSFNYKKAFAPKVDVKEEKDAYTMDMDLPGKTDKDINIEFNNNVLTISSESKSEKEEKKEEKAEAKEAPKYLIKERSYSKFSRSFSLPDDVESENISAKVENGVLHITLPRKAIAAPRRIAITAA